MPRPPTFSRQETSEGRRRGRPPALALARERVQARGEEGRGQEEGARERRDVLVGEVVEREERPAHRREGRAVEAARERRRPEVVPAAGEPRERRERRHLAQLVGGALGRDEGLRLAHSPISSARAARRRGRRQPLRLERLELREVQLRHRLLEDGHLDAGRLDAHDEAAGHDHVELAGAGRDVVALVGLAPAQGGGALVARGAFLVDLHVHPGEGHGGHAGQRAHVRDLQGDAAALAVRVHRLGLRGGDAHDVGARALGAHALESRDGFRQQLLQGAEVHGLDLDGSREGLAHLLHRLAGLVDVALPGGIAQLPGRLLDLGARVDGLRGLLLSAGGEGQRGGSECDSGDHAIAFLDRSGETRGDYFNITLRPCGCAKSLISQLQPHPTAVRPTPGETHVRLHRPSRGRAVRRPCVRGRRRRQDPALVQPGRHPHHGPALPERGPEQLGLRPHLRAARHARQGPENRALPRHLLEGREPHGHAVQAAPGHPVPRRHALHRRRRGVLRRARAGPDLQLLALHAGHHGGEEGRRHDRRDPDQGPQPRAPGRSSPRCAS